LTEIQRLSIEGVYLLGETRKEVSQRLGVKEDRVRNALDKGVKKLRELLAVEIRQ
jgi:DNA-directed RNA polymerase specialized sigma24 family protein